jgi:hypothetical protein
VDDLKDYKHICKPFVRIWNIRAYVPSLKTWQNSWDVSNKQFFNQNQNGKNLATFIYD